MGPVVRQGGERVVGGKAEVGKEGRPIHHMSTRNLRQLLRNDCDVHVELEVY